MDLTLPITGGTMLLIAIAVTGYFLREWMSESKTKREALETAVHQHIILCNEKAVSHARMEGKVERIGEKVEELKSSMEKRTGKIDKMDEKLDALAISILAKRDIIS